MRYIPNILTFINLFLGMVSLRFAVSGDIDMAVLAIFIAVIFDGFDGRVARFLNANSKIGGELDSLADFVSFGVAPAFVTYIVYYNTSVLVEISLFIYICCMAYRLARYNSMDEKKPYFQGIPAPSGACLLFLPLVLRGVYQLDIHTYQSIIYFLLVSILLISKIPTLSIGNLQFGFKKKKILFTLAFVLFLVLFLFRPYYMYTALVGIYIVSLPLAFFLYRKNGATFLGKKE